MSLHGFEKSAPFFAEPLPAFEVEVEAACIPAAFGASIAAAPAARAGLDSESRVQAGLGYILLLSKAISPSMFCLSNLRISSSTASPSHHQRRERRSL